MPEAGVPGNRGEKLETKKGSEKVRNRERKGERRRKRALDHIR